MSQVERLIFYPYPVVLSGESIEGIAPPPQAPIEEPLMVPFLSRADKGGFVQRLRKWLKRPSELLLAGSIAASGMGIGSPPAPMGAVNLNPPTATETSYQMDEPPDSFRNRFYLDTSPRQSTEQIPESQVENWQPENIQAFLTYLWAGNKKENKTWQGSYWIDNGSHPPRTWINHFLPIFDVNPDGTLDIEKQLYSANDPAFRERLFMLAQNSNINTLFISNWGPGSKSDLAMREVYEWANSPANTVRLIRLAPYVDYTTGDGKGGMLSKSELRRIIKSYKNTAKDNPFALKDPKDQKLIMGFYGSDQDTIEDIRRIVDISERMGVHAFIRPTPLMELDNKWLEVTGQKPVRPYGLIPYAPEHSVVRVELDGKVYAEVSGRFEKNTEREPRLPEDIVGFDKSVATVMAENPKFIDSIYGEIGEGATIEPTLRVKFQKNIKAVIDWDHSSGYAFLNILHRRLKPLPQIVPDQEYIATHDLELSGFPGEIEIFPGNQADIDIPEKKAA